MDDLGVTFFLGETPIYPLRNGLTQPMANLNDLFGDSLNIVGTNQPF